MIKIKKQLIFIPIPFLNAAPIFIIVYKNHRYLRKNWQIRIIPYMLATLVGGVLSRLFFFGIFGSFVNVDILYLLSFYFFGIFASIFMILFQKKNGIE